MQERGVIYYNCGTSCCVRLLVSLTSLRRHYTGPVTILSEGEESHRLCEKIAKATNADVKEWNSGVEPGANTHYLAKTRYHLGTPFEITIALDSDTLITGSLDELFDDTVASSFCIARFADWKSDGGTVAKRIREWGKVAPDHVERALKFGPAINAGIIAFRREATLLADWYPFALRGRGFFIPDEVSCQILLHRHAHRVLDGRWNRSCKYDDPDAPDTRIIHYHGRKHCRPGLPYHGAKWVSEFEVLHRENVADLRQWVPAGDGTLGRHLRTLDRNAESPLPSAREESRATIRAAILEATELRLVLGARKTAYQGWVSTDKDILDIRNRDDWQYLLGMTKARSLLAEHVWEHLSADEMNNANRLAFEFLKKGGCLRIAVPDGFHPDESYIAQVRPGGSGRSANDHQQLLNHQTLSASLRAVGFEVREIEYWDRTGVFHHKPWRSEDGHIKRSALHDRRNRHGRLDYTSLIVDAWKP